MPSWLFLTWQKHTMMEKQSFNCNRFQRITTYHYASTWRGGYLVQCEGVSGWYEIVQGQHISETPQVLVVARLKS